MGALQYKRPERIAALDERFADNLYATRVKLRITRRELAERTGIPMTSIEKIEVDRSHSIQGVRRRVTIGEAVALAEALGLKPGDLLKARAASDG